MPQLNMLVVADPSARYLSLLKNLGPSVTYEVTYDIARAQELAPSADIILTGVGAGGNIVSAAIEKASKLQWLHSLSAGVDHLMATHLRTSDIPVTNAKGA